jgi:hypothetical protein
VDACLDPSPIPLEAVDVAHAVVWATVATVDTRGRPRSRVLHPVWTSTATGCEGWVITRPTSVKFRHLAHNPHVSCAYLSAAHDVAYFDCTARWVRDPQVRRWAWTMVAETAPPVGYDPAAIIPGGVDSGDWALLHLVPFRIQVGRGSALAAGARPRLWSAA